MIINSLCLHQYQIPLTRQLPVGIQRIEQRQGLVLSLSARKDKEQDPKQVQVEISPLSGEDIDGAPLKGFSLESLAEVKQEMQRLSETLLGKDILCLREAANECQLPSLAYGLSLAYYQVKGDIRQARMIPTPIPLIYHFDGDPLVRLHEKLDNLDKSIQVVKVKVAQTSMEQELELIYQILARKPKLRLRLDANRGFDLETAIEFAASLPLEAIDYIEEPCTNPRDNIEVYKATGIRYALDETLNFPTYNFTPEPGLAALVVKPMILGCLDKLQHLVDEATKHGVRTVLSSSLEASLGIKALINLSAILTPDEAPGIDTLGAFSADIVESSGKSSCLGIDKMSTIFEYSIS